MLAVAQRLNIQSHSLDDREAAGQKRGEEEEEEEIISLEKAALD